MTSVNLSDDFVNKAKRYAKLENRSVPKQIEYWAKIGRIMEENPDLPYPFVMDLLESMAEAEAGETTPFVFSKKPRKKK